MVQQAGNRHLLVGHRVRSDDSATYMCYATNELGSSQKTISFEDHELMLESLDVEKGERRKPERSTWKSKIAAFHFLTQLHGSRKCRLGILYVVGLILVSALN